MAEAITVRHKVTGKERQIRAGAADFFANAGYEVLDAAGRKKAKQPATATNNDSKES